MLKTVQIPVEDEFRHTETWTDSQVRLLKLLAESQIELFTTQLSLALSSYFVISYMWGNGDRHNEPKSIHVRRCQ